MLDLTQTLMVLVVVILTAVMTVIGVQMIFILRDFRLVLQKLAGLVDRTEMILSGMIQPFTGVGGLGEGIKKGVGVIKKLSKILGRHKQTTEVEDYMERQ